MTRHVGARLAAPWLCACLLVAMRDDAGAAGTRPAADASLRVLRSAVISADNAANPHVESHLAVNPRDPAHLLATSMVSEGGDSSSHVYVSRDGGRHWTRSAIVQPI